MVTLPDGFHVTHLMTFAERHTEMHNLKGKWVRLSILAVVLGMLIIATITIVYAIRIRASAAALINSSRAIHSTEDAQRELATWRRRSDRYFWDEPSSNNSEHSYTIQVENRLLWRFHLVPPTLVGLTIT